ncbi:MAG: pyridoxal-phosphate dependent enzyme [Nitrolancea sp.]
MIYPNVLSTVGETPLIRLNKVTSGLRATVAAKLEMVNPGGSIKDRIAVRLIEEAEASGQLGPGGTVVEATSGNTGAGLAMTAAVKGYRAIFVLPDKVSCEKVALLRAFGAEVVLVPHDSDGTYYDVADRLTRDIPGAYQPNQYFNPTNPESHYLSTGPEIWRETEGKITHLVAGAGTGGTISGIARYLKEQNPDVRIIAADPEGSIYSSNPDDLHSSKVEGIGKNFWPGAFDPSLVDEFIQVADCDSLCMARRITREEGMLIGGSGGTAVCAALQVARRSNRPETLVVVVLPDGGRSYLSKVYDDDWMCENGFPTALEESTRDPIHAYHNGHASVVAAME